MPDTQGGPVRWHLIILVLAASSYPEHRDHLFWIDFQTSRKPPSTVTLLREPSALLEAAEVALGSRGVPFLFPLLPLARAGDPRTPNSAQPAVSSSHCPSR